MCLDLSLLSNFRLPRYLAKDEWGTQLGPELWARLNKFAQKLDEQQHTLHSVQPVLLTPDFMAEFESMKKRLQALEHAKEDAEVKEDEHEAKRMKMSSLTGPMELHV